MKKYKVENLLVGKVIEVTRNYIGQGIRRVSFTPKQYIILNSKTQDCIEIQDINGIWWRMKDDHFTQYFVQIKHSLGEILKCKFTKLTYTELSCILSQLNKDLINKIVYKK